MTLTITLMLLCAILTAALIFYREDAKQNKKDYLAALDVAIKNAAEITKINETNARMTALKEQQRANEIIQSSNVAIDRRDAFSNDWVHDGTVDTSTDNGVNSAPGSSDIA